MQLSFTWRPHIPKVGLYAALTVLALCVVPLSACGTSSSTSQNSNAPITIWVDADRMKAVQEYEAAHPGSASKIHAGSR